jgi:hypothetical protein
VSFLRKCKPDDVEPSAVSSINLGTQPRDGFEAWLEMEEACVSSEEGCSVSLWFFFFENFFFLSLNDDPGRDTIAAFSGAPLRRVEISIPYNSDCVSPVSCWLSLFVHLFRHLGNAHCLHCSLYYGLSL